MTQERNSLTDLFAACWKDDALKARFEADPKAVLSEYGINIQDGVDIKVVENTDNTVHITMPMAPSIPSALSDAELSSAAGGAITDVGCGGGTLWTICGEPGCKGHDKDRRR